LLLIKITEIDERLKKIENKTDAIHHYVPFVGWLDEQAKKLIQLNWFNNNDVEDKKYLE
jgi:hypothetical protein